MVYNIFQTYQLKYPLKPHNVHLTILFYTSNYTEVDRKIYPVSPRLYNYYIQPRVK